MSFDSTNIFNFDECSIYQFFLLLIVLLVSKTLPRQRSWRFSCLLPKSFIVLHCTFKFLIRVELIFVQGQRFRLRFIFLAYRCPIALAPFVEKAVCLHCIALATLLKVGRVYLWVHFWTSYSVSLICVDCSTTTTLSWLPWLYNKLECHVEWFFSLYSSRLF